MINIITHFFDMSLFYDQNWNNDVIITVYFNINWSLVDFYVMAYNIYIYIYI